MSEDKNMPICLQLHILQYCCLCVLESMIIQAMWKGRCCFKAFDIQLKTRIKYRFRFFFSLKKEKKVITKLSIFLFGRFKCF